jgi:hypothetical protein
VEWYPRGRAIVDDERRRWARPATHGVAGRPGPQSMQHKRPELRVAQQSVPLGGRNPGRTAGAGRGATSGSNHRGTSEAGWQGATVLAVVSRVPTVETVEPDSQRKSRSAGLGEVARGKLSSSKTTCHVERRSGGLWRDQGSGSLCDQRSSQGRHTR